MNFAIQHSIETTPLYESRSEEPSKFLQQFYYLCEVITGLIKGAFYSIKLFFQAMADCCFCFYEENDRTVAVEEDERTETDINLLNTAPENRARPSIELVQQIDLKNQLSQKILSYEYLLLTLPKENSVAEEKQLSKEGLNFFLDQLRVLGEEESVELLENSFLGPNTSYPAAQVYIQNKIENLKKEEVNVSRIIEQLQVQLQQ